MMATALAPAPFATTTPRRATDPRPDLTADTAAWSRLLPLADALDGDDPAGLFGALLGLRCCGASLAHTGGLWRIGPGEMTAAEYAALRSEYLVPRSVMVADLLAEMTGDR